jgi:hypothetical protein
MMIDEEKEIKSLIGEDLQRAVLESVMWQTPAIIDSLRDRKCEGEVFLAYNDDWGYYISVIYKTCDDKYPEYGTCWFPAACGNTLSADYGRVLKETGLEFHDLVKKQS